jgi:hypothetical protein
MSGGRGLLAFGWLDVVILGWLGRNGMDGRFLNRSRSLFRFLGRNRGVEITGCAVIKQGCGLSVIVVTRCAETAATAGVVLGYVEPVLADELGQFQRPMFLKAARLPRELLDYSNGP